LKKHLITTIKFAISFTILAYLFHQTRKDPETLQRFWNESKGWWELSVGTLCVLMATVISFLRWRMLVRALGLTFTVPDALRLGFLGCLFNSISLGPVGGDLVKAFYIAREQPGRRTEAVATVVVDRIIGLYSMLLVASIAFLSFDWSSVTVSDQEPLKKLHYVCSATAIVAGIFTVCILIVLLPGFTTSSWWEMVTRIPFVGGTIERLLRAVQTYRCTPSVLVTALLMSLSVHALFCIAVYFMARGLPGETPNLGTFFVVIPVVNATQAVPLPGGLGAFEYALDVTYRCVAPVGVPPRQGFLIALAVRLAMLLTALTGMGYWLFYRKEFSDLVQQAEAQEHAVKSGVRTG